MQLRALRIDGEAGTELDEGLVEVALLKIGDAKVLVQGWIVWGALERSQVERDSAHGIASLNMGQTSVGQDLGIVGPGCEDFVEEWKSMGKIFGCLIGEGEVVAEIDGGGGCGRSFREGFLKEGDGFPFAVSVDECPRELKSVGGVGRSELAGAFERDGGLGGLPGLERD